MARQWLVNIEQRNELDVGELDRVGGDGWAQGPTSAPGCCGQQNHHSVPGVMATRSQMAQPMGWLAGPFSSRRHEGSWGTTIAFVAAMVDDGGTRRTVPPPWQPQHGTVGALGIELDDLAAQHKHHAFGDVGGTVCDALQVVGN
jgi:hypothetical protein